MLLTKDGIEIPSFEFAWDYTYAIMNKAMTWKKDEYDSPKLIQKERVKYAGNSKRAI